MSSATPPPFPTPPPEDWRAKLAIVVDMMRDMSRQTDPEDMVRSYGSRMRQLRTSDGLVALSRRGVEPPRYRITRSSLWAEAINPWREPHRLPVLEGGFLGELIYRDEPRIVDDLSIDPADPAAEHLREYRSLIAIPVYDQGVALNMTVLLRRDPRGFAPEQFPDTVLMTNLFGRATQTLVLAEELRAAYAKVEQELRMVAEIQRSLLPAETPDVAGLDLAVHYQTSRVAGGDYYDFFPLPDGRWGILIADVSGHGTPAAVLMAITHSLVHVGGATLASPAATLAFVNRHFSGSYAFPGGQFVTAFYAVYDPRTRALTYASAGHHPPLWKRSTPGCAQLDGATGLPLGVEVDERYEERTQTLDPGDVLILYTDGITEAFDAEGTMFGLPRLDAAASGAPRDAGAVLRAILDALTAFAGGRPADDDRTLLVARVR